MMFLKHLRTSVIALVLFTIITGLIYPATVTVISQLFFPEKAQGSIIIKRGNILGSELIGQQFTSSKYFWSRISATSPFPYNSASSLGSNYGPLNPALFKAVQDRVRELHASDSSNKQLIAADLVTASGSGLDPHISIAAAMYQIPRVARARSISEQQIRTLVDRFTDPRGLGFLGEPGVNVLKLNITLDEMSSIGDK